MAAFRSNKSQGKRGTSFGKRSDAEKSFRKNQRPSRDEGSRDSRSERSPRFDKPKAGGFERSERQNRTGSGDDRRPPRNDSRPRREGSSRPAGFTRAPKFDEGSGKRNFRSAPPRFNRDDEAAGKFKKFDRGKGGKGSFRKDSGSSFRGESKFRTEPGSVKKPFDKEGSKPGRSSSGHFKKDQEGADKFKKFDRRSSKSDKGSFRKDSDSSFRGESRFRTEQGGFKKPFHKQGPPRRDGNDEKGKRSFVQSRVAKVVRSGEFTKAVRETSSPAKKDDGLIRLNKFIANSGVGSRREADELIKMGLIKVNGTTITELGTKIKPTDEVRYEDRLLRAERLVYVLLNKPKGFITTTDDPQERNTVMSLVASACKERIYPVGRLDRNTTGLLLLTNDGDLADKLTHPSYNTKKVYKIELDKALTKNDLQQIVDGVQLEEGRAMVDDVAVLSDDRHSVGLEIHIGWNRVVRRIFETLGYEVRKLDRSVFAGLDKKELSRGEWRFLRPEEVVRLKHFK